MYMSVYVCTYMCVNVYVEACMIVWLRAFDFMWVCMYVNECINMNVNVLCVCERETWKDEKNTKLYKDGS